MWSPSLPLLLLIASSRCEPININCFGIGRCTSPEPVYGQPGPPAQEIEISRPLPFEFFNDAPPRYVYRGDTRSPLEIENNVVNGKSQPGFYPLNGPKEVQQYGLYSHVEGNIGNTPYVSTTGSLDVAGTYVARTKKSGYIYKIEASSNFVDVNKSLRMHKYLSNMEHAAMDGIPYSQVVGYAEYTKEHMYQDPITWDQPLAFQANDKYQPVPENLQGSQPRPELAGFPPEHPAWTSEPWVTLKDANGGTLETVEAAYKRILASEPKLETLIAGNNKSPGTERLNANERNLGDSKGQKKRPDTNLDNEDVSKSLGTVGTKKSPKAAALDEDIARPAGGLKGSKPSPNTAALDEGIFASTRGSRGNQPHSVTLDENISKPGGPKGSKNSLHTATLDKGTLTPARGSKGSKNLLHAIAPDDDLFALSRRPKSKVHGKVRGGTRARLTAAFTALSPYAHDILDETKKIPLVGPAIEAVDDSMTSLQEAIGGEQVSEIDGNMLKLRLLCAVRGSPEHKNPIDHACDRMRKEDAETDPEVKRAKQIQSFIYDCVRLEREFELASHLKGELNSRCDAALSQIADPKRLLSSFNVLRIWVGLKGVSESDRISIVVMIDGAEQTMYDGPVRDNVQVRKQFETPVPLKSLRRLRIIAKTKVERTGRGMWPGRGLIFTMKEIILRATNNETDLWLQNRQLAEVNHRFPYPRWARRNGWGSALYSTDLTLEKWRKAVSRRRQRESKEEDCRIG